MNRRNFVTRVGSGALFVLAGGLSILTTGCTAFSTILSWINVGLTSFQSIVDLLAGAGVINIVLGSAIDLIIKAVKAGIADIGAAVTSYNDAPAASKANLLGKIGTALMTAQNAIAGFWNDVSIPDPKLASTVAGLLGIMVSTLAAFQTQVPTPPVAAVRLAKQLPAAAPKARSVKQYKADFNALLTANGYPQYTI